MSAIRNTGLFTEKESSERYVEWCEYYDFDRSVPYNILERNTASMKKTHAQIAIGLVCLIMAFAITLQIRSVSYNRANNADTARAADLQQQLRVERERTTNLYEQILELSSDLEEFKGEAAKSSDYSKVLAKQLERAEVLAGLTTVEGPGVIVTLRDSSGPNTGNIDPSLYIVHDTDILWLINELRDAGAEAISLNGERLISTSEIRCAGSTVSVNNNRHADPYEIIAIGDSANMENALLMRDGVYDTLRGYGIGITIKKASKVTVNAYKGNILFKYAFPLQLSPAKEAE
ncbi:MAG: DUF881 domain-containing protein [Firmicutes bacterium]|nr:DUF881 domain-containing protein [Bacillota bacterium]